MEKKMKIAFIGARGVPHGYSSAEQITLNVGKRLIERGHEFTVYCRSNLFEDRAPYYEGIRRVFVPTIEHKIFGQIIHGFLSGAHSIFQDYDVLHIQCLTNVFQSVLPWIVKRNVVINVNGQEWDNPKWPKPFRHIFFKSAIYTTFAISREFITDAVGMHDIYKERYNKESTIIEYGAELVEPKNPKILEKYGLIKDGYYFIAARIVPSNQIHVLVDAFKRSGSKKILAIAGGGAYGRDYYKNLVKDSGENVKFLGMISDQTQMDELYANGYAYLHGASLGGINSALLRPVGAGCVGLAYDTPFNREVLELSDGRTSGYLWKDALQLSEGIKKFDSDPNYVAELSRLGKIQIKRNFTWDLVTDQYEVFYRGFVEKWSPEKIRQKVAAQKEKYRDVK